MPKVLIIPQYFKWHYQEALKNIFELWKDFSWFVLRFFSINKLLRTLISPFKRLKENPDGPGLQSFFESLIVNTIMRVVGFLLRSTIIIIGLLTYICVTVFSIVFLVFWFVLPLALSIITLYAFADFFNFLTI